MLPPDLVVVDNPGTPGAGKSAHWFACLMCSSTLLGNGGNEEGRAETAHCLPVLYVNLLASMMSL